MTASAKHTAAPETWCAPASRVPMTTNASRIMVEVLLQVRGAIRLSVTRIIRKSYRARYVCQGPGDGKPQEQAAGPFDALSPARYIPHISGKFLRGESRA